MDKKIIFILAILLVPLSVTNAFGHGLGGDQAPPISFGDMDVTVFTQLTPSDITVGEIDKANMGVRFFDLLTNKNLDAVTYRIEVWRSDDLLARELFYDQNGQLDVEIRPDSKCEGMELIHCTKYFGEREQISNGLMKRGTQPPVIDGPIFDKGGLYNIKVDIEGASSPKTLVVQPLNFETFVSVAQEQDFVIQSAYAQEIPVIIKTYYDDISNFDFNESKESISFDMPFDWNPSYVDQVKVVHEEIRVPKSFEPYSNNQFRGFVNGVELTSRAVLSDPYSSENQNIVHFLVTGNELKNIASSFNKNKFDANNAHFELMPILGEQKHSTNISFDSGIDVSIKWNNKKTDQGIPLDITFFDKSDSLLKDVRYGFTLTDKNGHVLYTNIGNDVSNLGITASEGLDTQIVPISESGEYGIEIALFSTGIGSNQSLDLTGLGKGTINIEFGSEFQQDFKSTLIPDWIRNNAGWWSSGQISDDDFVKGIGYLLENKIITVQYSETSDNKSNTPIPDWIRNNAGWWSSGQISDDDFVKGIEFLVENGIIRGAS